jgi:flavin reductase (DIM6/NTAB) family NADH-FMN oxidoreductase RutF
MEYQEMPLDEAYRLINTGPVVMVATVSGEGAYDVAPIAWACPARKSPTRVLVGVGKSHKTFTNIQETGVFVAGVPNISQAELVKASGTVSGHDVDKFVEYSIESISAKQIGCQVPTGMIGYIECKVAQVYDTGKLALILGDALYAAVDPQAYDGDRILSEEAAGKTVHHLGNKRFMTLGDQIIE